MRSKAKPLWLYLIVLALSCKLMALVSAHL